MAVDAEEPAFRGECVESSACAKFCVVPLVPMVGENSRTYTLPPTSWDPEMLGMGVVGGSDHPKSVGKTSI